jgi:hypothetical protein
MNNITLLEKSAHQAVAAKAITLAALLIFWALPGQAAQSSAQFIVTINLQSPDSGLCRSGTKIGTFGAAVTVVCTTGAIASFSGNSTSLSRTTMQDSSYRFVTQVSRAGESLGTVDSYTGGGTVTSWRVISLVNQDYLEMMVHW